MGFETKLPKNFSPIEHRRLGLGILAGLVLSLTYLSPSIFYSFPFTIVNLRTSSMNAAPTSQMTNDSMINSPKSGLINATHESLLKCSSSGLNQELCEKKDGFVRINRHQSANASTVGKGDADSTQILLDKLIESKSGNLTIEDSKADQLKMNSDVMVSKNSSTMTTINTNSTQGQIGSNSEKLSEAKREDVKPKETKPLCDFSNRRSNLCDMYGDIRIHGKSASVVSVTYPQPEDSSQRNESWQIRPYARKTDLGAMSSVRDFTVRSSNSYQHPPHCTLNHSVPAVIFSVAGYTGNFFHDFTDVLVPLFLTTYQFSGEVQFLVTNFRLWWLNKYRPIINGLSKYELIDLDKDDQVHCFQHVVVGLNSHDDLKIDTQRSPNGYSMVDFTKFLRTAYSLPRASPLTIGKQPLKKPRLLIVARSRTRRFTNINKIVKMAEKSGYEVIVGEAESNVTHFAHIVNTCDVMMGVHGAGLTNFVFLPTNAILIQIVPWGRLDWIARAYFDEPAKGVKLRYLEYRISVDESTLAELYPRDHPVLKDPLSSVHKFGWESVKETYLVKQNVKLNVRRFRPVLLKALKLLHEQ